MDIVNSLLQRLQVACGDPELGRLSPGLIAKIGFTVGSRTIALEIADSNARIVRDDGAYDVSVTADEDAWSNVVALNPPPTYHSFTALQLANPRFEVIGDPLLIALCRPVLERLVELAITASPLQTQRTRRDITAIAGHYVPVNIEGGTHDLYVEKAGTGIPVLFLHTAGADSRQFLKQLSDLDLGQAYEMFAVDMPFHGRSLPPASWKGESYTLTKARYLSWCCAIIDQVVGRPPIVVGGSMGAAMSMVLAAERPELVRGIVAVEPPFRSQGRRNPYQHHVAVHGSLHNASYVRGLMSPFSPESDRRLASWIYSQSAPGIYSGDLAFYSDEFDGAVTGPKIDCHRTPVVLLCGTYDYSASPVDGRRLTEVIDGARMEIMEGLGHFPMCENADLFRPYLLSALQFLDHDH